MSPSTSYVNLLLSLSYKICVRPEMIAVILTCQNSENEKFLKIVKNITSKGFVRSNYEEKLVDLSDVRINLKTKN